MSLGKKIRDRRKRQGLTQDRVAELAGISKPYLSNIETGRIKNPPTDGVLEALEAALEFQPGALVRLAHLERTPRDVRREHEELSTELSKLRGMVRKLLSGDAATNGALDLESLAEQLDLEPRQPLTPTGTLVPIINRVAAGYPQGFTDLDYPPSVADEYIRCPDLNDPQAFATRVVGDSMAPDYAEGDIVVFSPNAPPRNGDDCFVRFADDEGTTFKRFYQDDEASIRLQPINSAYPGQTFPLESITGLWPAIYRIQRLR